MQIIITWLTAAVAIMISAYILPGVVLEGLIAALVLAVVLGAINAFIKPLVIVLTLPINVLTLGLFTLVIDAALIMLAAMIVPGFGVTSFWWALLFAVVLSLVNAVFAHFGGKK